MPKKTRKHRKKRDDESKNSNRVLNTLKIIFAIWVFVFLLANIIVPAMISYSMVCNDFVYEKIENQLEEQGQQLVTKGVISAGNGEEGTREITKENLQELVVNIHVGEGDENMVYLKHELIHLNQLFRNPKNLQCRYPFRKYLSEVEAYTFQWLPNPLFRLIYKSHPEDFESTGATIVCEQCKGI